MLLYCKTISPRLSYIIEFIGKEINADGILLTSDLNQFREYNEGRINYSEAPLTGNECWIIPHSLLFETNIAPQLTDCYLQDNQKTFFKTGGDMGFDLLAASFYLISRYEEYLPHQKDAYGRFDPQSSLADKEGFLNKPLVNIWLESFKKKLKEKFPSCQPGQSQFTFTPTYDIDMAWSWRNKGWMRTTGGLIRSLLKGNWKEFKGRIRNQRDTYDAYGWMNQLHEKFKLKPYYFFLVAEKTGRFDKNISPSNRHMQALIRDHAIRYPVGVHPSWQSGDDISKLKKEIDLLCAISGHSIRASRQHYIRFNLPETFQQLLDNGIQFDFSMGYGSRNGFRASTCTPFYWYDLKNEKKTGLLLFPFCFMDANSFYEQKMTASQALEELKSYYRSVKSVNGVFIMIWHNSFLGTDPQFGGWREMYEQFIIEVSKSSV
jgi:hypothetical protein